MRTMFLHALAILLASTAAAAQVANAPCFETNLGTNLNLGDDQVAQGQALGFTFPGPAGNVTSIDISSNGFIWLASNSNSACCSGDVPTFLSDLPRIAAMWTDLYPPGGNGVFFNSFVNVPNNPDRAVITWDATELGGAGPFVVQLQLMSDGTFTLFYDARVDNLYHTCLIGVTQGNNATQNGIDFSTIVASAPYNSGTNPTIHEDFNSTFDLAGKSFDFLPNGTGGYLVFERAGCRMAGVEKYGQGCPQPAVVYELFSPGTVDLSNQSLLFIPNGAGGYSIVAGPNLWFSGFTNNLGLTDDSIGTVTLPFPFAHPGGSVSSVDVCSNGFVWLGSNSNINYIPTVGEFLTDLPRIAPLWMDLNPSAGGGVYADLDTATGEFVITWSAVPEYFSTGMATMQLALQASGIFELRYQGVSSASHDAMTGYTVGNGANDPGNRDLSLLPINTGPAGLALDLDVQSGSLPRLNSTLVQEVTNIPANAAVGAYVLGLHQAAIDLTAVGMPGCTGWVDFVTPGASSVIFYPVTPPMLTFSFPVPNSTGLVGFSAFGQAVALASGYNAIGIIASNGLRLDFGR